MLLALAAAGATTIGANVHLPPQDTLDLEVDLGAKWIRIDFNWDIAEPAEGQWNWAPFDAVIDGAKARGLYVYATLAYTPAWASTGDRRGDGSNNDVPDATKYRAFVTAVAARYGASIDMYGTWNEPNLADFFEGTRDEWRDIVYRPCIEAVRATCSACKVAGPEVATIGTAYPDYLSAALTTDLPDVISGHIYASFPEDDSTAGLTKDSFYNKLDSHRVIGPYQGPLSIRESALAAGAGALPIWITETGREAAPGDTAALAAQQTYVQRVLDAMATRSWWGSTIFYEISEEHPGGMWPDIHWGLALRTSDPTTMPLSDFAPKPAYDYLKARLATVPGSDAGATDGAPDAGVLGPDAGTQPGPDGGANGEQTPAPAGCGCRSANGGDAFGVAVVLFGLTRRRRYAIARQ